jgi:hypothetical protein
MDYPLAISPDLKIDAEEFSAVWNQDPESKGIAQAHASASGNESYPFISPEMIQSGLVLLTGVASTVVLDAIKDVIKERIKKILSTKAGSDAPPRIDVIVIQTEGKPVIVVMAKA